MNWKEITKQLGVERVELDDFTKVIFCKGDEETLVLEKVIEYNAKGETHYQVSGKRVF
jgi:NACalpha-BTF3-like transcription factor